LEERNRGALSLIYFSNSVTTSLAIEAVTALLLSSCMGNTILDVNALEAIGSLGDQEKGGWVLSQLGARTMRPATYQYQRLV
jgi:hypothetical protein